jgi:hypothetical protein
MASIVNADATGEIEGVDGTLNERLCTPIGGTVSVQFLNTTVEQFIDICELSGKKYEMLPGDNPITGPLGCIQIEASGRDPVTGKRYDFGNPCAVPRGCDATSDWGGNLPSYYVHQHKIRFNGTEYSFFIGADDFWCTHKLFDIDTKKFAFDAIGRSTGETLIMDIAVPEKILGGNFTLLVDGNVTSFETAKREGYTIVSTTLPPYGQYKGVT